MAEIPIDVSENNDKYEAVAVLTQLGIMDINDDGSFHGDDFITRAELAKIAAVIRNIDGNDYANAEIKYSDVDRENEYAKYIMACTEYGFMRGDGENFEPDGNVNADQLNAIVMRLMGYEPIAQTLGGYPLGYTGVAERIKIRKYLSQSGEYMTKNEVASYLYEALDAPSAQAYSMSGDNIEYSVDSDKALSELYMGIKRFEGIVGANEFSALPGKNTLSAGKVEIDGTVMNGGTTDIKSELGKYVVAYAYVDAKGNCGDIKTYVTPSKYNEEVEILAKDLDTANTNSNKISVWKGNKRRSYSLRSDCIVIKNGEVLTNYSDDVFNITTGKIFVINTNGSGYDLVIVDAPQSMIFRSYSENLQTLYFYYGAEKIELPNEAKVEVFIDGEAAALSDLSEWMCVFAFKSENHNYYRFDVSSKSVKGEYTARDYDNDKIEVDRTTYNAASEFDDYAELCRPMRLGVVYTFIFNPYDEITAIIDEEISDGGYGFVCSSDMNSFKDSVYLHIFTESNEKKRIKLSKKVTVEYGASVQSVDAQELLTDSGCGLVDDGGEVIKQLIKYNLTSDGQINRICIAVDNSANESCDNDYFTLDMKKFGSGTIYYYNGSFGGVFLGDSSTLKVFTVPAKVVNGVPNITDVSDIEVEDDTNIKSLYLNNFYLYDADKYRRVGAIVRFVEDVNTVNSDIIGRPETAVITKIRKAVLQSGDEGYNIEYLQGGKQLNIEADEDIVTATCNNSNWREYEGTKLSDLKCGDVVQIVLDAEGKKVKYIYKIGSASSAYDDHERVSSSSTTTPISVSSAKIHTIPGTVKETNSGYIVVSTVAGNGVACDRSFKKNATTRYYIYHSDRDIVGLATADDVFDGDVILARLDGYLCRMVLIVR